MYNLYKVNTIHKRFNNTLPATKKVISTKTRCQNGYDDNNFNNKNNINNNSDNINNNHNFTNDNIDPSENSKNLNQSRNNQNKQNSFNSISDCPVNYMDPSDCLNLDQKEILKRLKSAFQLSCVEKRQLHGHEIYEWIVNKWQRFFHVELVLRGTRMYMVVTPIEVPEKDVIAELIALDIIADKLTEWYMIEHVECMIDNFMFERPSRNPVLKSVYIPLDVFSRLDQNEMNVNE